MNSSLKIILTALIFGLVSCSILKSKTHHDKILSGKHFNYKYSLIKVNTGIDMGRNKGTITLKLDGTIEVVTPTGAMEGGPEYMTLTHKYGVIGDTIFANGPFYDEVKYLMNSSRDSIKMIYPEEKRNWTHIRTTANKK